VTYTLHYVSKGTQQYLTAIGGRESWKRMGNSDFGEGNDGRLMVQSRAMRLTTIVQDRRTDDGQSRSAIIIRRRPTADTRIDKEWWPPFWMS